ncbi:hypothetical protein O1157_02350 [Streptomyces albogriseolus]
MFLFVVAGATRNVGAMLRLMAEDVVETTLGILGEPTEAQPCPGLGVEGVPGRPPPAARRPPRAFAGWARATRTCSVDPGRRPGTRGSETPAR